METAIESAALPRRANAPDARPAAAPRAVRWYVWCAVLAVTSAMIGGHWDISWHRSIGRDSFWTPAHVAIYLCGVLGGLSSGFLILSTTLRGERAATVGIWGFRGPLGAFIAAWGGIAMIVSAPFDNWWHAAYGLDVQILSPPHTVLMLGIFAVQVGTLILVLGEMNRAEGRARARLDAVFLYVGGLMVVAVLLGTLEFTDAGLMHSALFYRAVACTVPCVFAGVARASSRRFATTIVALVYTAVMLGFLWILPLFPAEPKLAPVYTQVTHFIPPGFPLLVLAPAIVLDLLRIRTGEKNRWRQAVFGGAAFLGALVAAQWPFADFLLSPGARNWVFGAHYVGFFEWNDFQFWKVEHGPAEFWQTMGIALAIAVVGTRVGIAWGDWMRRLRR